MSSSEEKHCRSGEAITIHFTKQKKIKIGGMGNHRFGNRFFISFCLLTILRIQLRVPCRPVRGVFPCPWRTTKESDKKKILFGFGVLPVGCIELGGHVVGELTSLGDGCEIGHQQRVVELAQKLGAELVRINGGQHVGHGRDLAKQMMVLLHLQMTPRPSERTNRSVWFSPVLAALPRRIFEYSLREN